MAHAHICIMYIPLLPGLKMMDSSKRYGFTYCYNSRSPQGPATFSSVASLGGQYWGPSNPQGCKGGVLVNGCFVQWLLHAWNVWLEGLTVSYAAQVYDTSLKAGSNEWETISYISTGCGNSLGSGQMCYLNVIKWTSFLVVVVIKLLFCHYLLSSSLLCIGMHFT